VKTCPFETIKGFISKNNKRLAKLKKKLKETDEANKMLQHTIIQLNNRLDAMSEALDAKSGNINTKCHCELN
jgi:septal ring factor EnvC (AmiA/AmiB activator)